VVVEDSEDRVRRPRQVVVVVADLEVVMDLKTQVVQALLEQEEEEVVVDRAMQQLQLEEAVVMEDQDPLPLPFIDNSYYNIHMICVRKLTSYGSFINIDRS
jgi:hypothetical protein